MVAMRALTLAAVVAAAAQSVEASSSGLRAMIATRMNTALEAPIVNTGSCKLEESRLTEDRECEDATTKQSERCQCRARCNCWGDPHCAPFFSKCPASTMSQEGNYTMWALDDQNVKIEAGVIPKNGRVWLMRLFVNGKLAMDAEKDCGSSRRSLPSRGDVIPLYADGTKRSGDTDAEVEWNAYCRFKHSTMHLSVTIDVRDDCSPTLPSASTDTWWKDSTPVFKSDYGVCTDPNKFGVPNSEEVGSGGEPKYNCNREMDRPLDGKKACRAECAAYGDPHIYPYDSYHGKNADFTVPKKPSRDETVLYSFMNEFAVEMLLDTCELIAGVRVWQKKDNTGTACAAADTASVSPADYDIEEYMAKDYCVEESDFNPATRKRITVPSEGDDSYDVGSQGYALGRFVKVNGNLVNAPSKVSSVSSCAGTLQEIDGIVEMGGVQLTLKCHRTRSKVPYFNVCVRRKEVVENAYSSGASTYSDLEPLTTTFGSIEKDGKTSGWCATGDYAGRRGKAQGKFVYRNRGEAQKFVFPDEQA